MVARAPVEPALIRWARERAGMTQAELVSKFKKLPKWERGVISPTLRQLEEFARTVHVPIGDMFLDEPPDEPLPITDFRTIRNSTKFEASPNLMATIYAMQRRQDWLQEYLIEIEEDPLPFVACASLDDDPEAVGLDMRHVVGLDDGWAESVHTWQEAVNKLRHKIEDIRVMAVINGVVGNNTHRPLSVEEFRGFALSDDYAPLIFVNGKDAKSAQMFTLAHELAHIWLGEGGLSGFEKLLPGGTEVEEWCNRAAAEFLLPSNELQKCWAQAVQEREPFKFLAKLFKVSPVVAARRAMDLNLIDKKSFFSFYETCSKQSNQAGKTSSGGGNFYNTQNARIGKLFATRVINAALGGQVGFREAYRLTGLGGGTFQNYATHLGIRLG